jgi:uncharacterized protein
MTIVVTGGSGMIGTELVQVLLSKGHTVIVIDTRGPTLTHERLFFIPCDLSSTTLPFNVLERTDAVINLVGAPINKRWNPEVKKQIIESRTQSVQHIVESIGKTSSRPSIFISASAVGFYGETGEVGADENAKKGEGFLSDTVAKWEAEMVKAEDYGARVVIVRTAPVLARGGFLAPLWNSARFRVTPYVFKNDFSIPWIHINDLIRVYLFALETGTLQGVVNAVAPTHTRYTELIRAFRSVLKTVSIRVSRIASLFLGKEMLEALSQNQIIIPQRLIDKGFSFAFTDIREAIESFVQAGNKKKKKHDHETN